MLAVVSSGAQCPAVGSIHDGVGGAWVFRGSRLPVSVTEQLRGGVTPYPARPARMDA
jgi:hypothetical protein